MRWFLLRRPAAALFTCRRVVRRERLLCSLTLAFTLGLLIYANKSGHVDQEIESVSDYKEINAYETLYKGIYDKEEHIRGHENINSFRVVSIRSINRTTSKKTLDKLNRTEIGQLFGLFYSNKVFLADVELIEKTNNALKLHSKLNTYLESDQDERLFLSFGYRYRNLSELENLEDDFFFSNLSLKCDLKQAISREAGLSENGRILAGWYLVCQGLVLHLAIFYPRGDFYWISSDDFYLNGGRKVFGDKARAIKK
jgi:hypothetical protein